MSKSPSTTLKTSARVTPAASTDSGVTGPGKQVFVGTMLGMSWQLAFAVLVPIYAGYRLDEHLKSSPLWTLLGFLVGIVLSVLVMKRALQELNRNFEATTKSKEK